MIFIHYKNADKDKPTVVPPYQTKSNYVWSDLSIPEIATLMGKGYAWRAGIYSEGCGRFKKAEVLGAQLIALDFDKCDFTPEDVIDYADSIGFTPNIQYYSFGQGVKGGNNFRVVWCLEQGITPKAYEEIYRTLLVTFERFNPDDATKDCSRLWYGGRNAEVISEDPIRMSSCGWLAIVDKAKQGIELRKAIKGQKAGLPDYAELDMPDRVQVGMSKAWWDCLRGRCRLWDMWERGEYLDYNQRLTLFTNLKFLTYSDNTHSVYDDIMKFYKPEVYKDHTFDEAQLRRIMLDRTLRPVPIVKSKNWQKIDASLGNTNNIYSTTNRSGSNWQKTVPEFFKEEYNNCSLIGLHDNEPEVETLDEWFDNNFATFLNAPGIAYLQCQTGAGKTEAMIRYLAQEDLTTKKVVYAVPTHNLIKEFGARYSKQFSQNEAHLLPKRDFSKADQYYLQMGLPAKTSDPIRAKFIKDMLGAENGLWVITHTLLTYIPDINADIIVVDENIEDALFRNTKISDTALSSVATYIGGQAGRDLRSFIDDLRKLEQGDEINLARMRTASVPLLENIEDYLNTHNATSVPKGYFYCMNVECGRRGHEKNEVCIRISEKTPLITNALINNIPIKIMTATPMPARIQNAYGANIKVFKAPHCRNKGRIIQYTAKTGARGVDNANLAELADYAFHTLPEKDRLDVKIITFKDTANYMGDLSFQLATINGEQIHFRNCAGLDELKGKKIAIIGKFDRPATYYEELWEDIGDGSPLTMNNHTQIINGVKQTLYLYDEPRIRQEQIDYINMVVAQAAGRARALREENAKVYIFCNFIIEDVDEIH